LFDRGFLVYAFGFSPRYFQRHIASKGDIRKGPTQNVALAHFPPLKRWSSWWSPLFVADLLSAKIKRDDKLLVPYAAHRETLLGPADAESRPFFRRLIGRLLLKTLLAMEKELDRRFAHCRGLSG